MTVGLDELKEPALLFPRQRFPCHRIVHHDRGQLEVEGVLSNSVVFDGHPKGGTKDAPNRVDAAVAAMSIAGKISMFAFSAMLGFGQGFQPVASFNYGAELYGRVKEAVRFTAITGTVIMTAAAAVCIIFAHPLIGAFRADDPEVMEIGVMALRLQAILLPLTGLVTTTNMGLQSTGQALPATVLAMARQGICFIPLILILPSHLGILGVEIAQPLSDFITFIAAVFFFVSFQRMLNGKEAGKAQNHTGL